MSFSYEQYLLFTAYSLTSAFAQDGTCVTNSGAPTPLQTPYSVANQGLVTADSAQYQSAVATWFVTFLDVPDWGICGENGSLAVHMAYADTTAFVNVAVPTTLGVALPGSFESFSSTVSLAAIRSSLLTPASPASFVSPSNIASLAATQSSLLTPASPASFVSPSNIASLAATQSSLPTPASPGLSSRVKAAIALVVSVLILALVLPGLILWYKHRKPHAEMMERKIKEKLETETETEIEPGSSRGV